MSTAHQTLAPHGSSADLLAITRPMIFPEAAPIPRSIGPLNHIRELADAFNPIEYTVSPIAISDEATLHDLANRFVATLDDLRRHAAAYGGHGILIGDLIEPDLIVERLETRDGAVHADTSDSNSVLFRWDRVIHIAWPDEFRVSVIHLDDEDNVACVDFAANIDWWNILS